MLGVNEVVLAVALGHYSGLTMVVALLRRGGRYRSQLVGAGVGLQSKLG
jgi:hypothetical protein